MKYFLSICVILTTSLTAQELKVKSDYFTADQKKGISIFTGHVNVIKENDELNASKVTIYTDAKNQPTKFVAQGRSKFKIKTEDGLFYRGKADMVVYFPNKKEYHFYRDVHLKQLNDKKEIMGEEVVLNTIEGKAFAKGAKNEPVTMIFNIPEKKEKKENNTTKEQKVQK